MAAPIRPSAAEGACQDGACQCPSRRAPWPAPRGVSNRMPALRPRLQDKQIRLFHRNTGPRHLVVRARPGGGSLPRTVSPNVTGPRVPGTQAPLATRAGSSRASLGRAEASLQGLLAPRSQAEGEREDGARPSLSWKTTCRPAKALGFRSLPLRPRLQDKQKASEPFPRKAPSPFVLGPEAGKSESESSLRALFQTLRACGSRGSEPRWFSKLRVLGACLSGAGLKVVATSWGSTPLLLQEKLRVWVPSQLGVAARGGGGGSW